jgi:hypothetical protein
MSGNEHRNSLGELCNGYCPEFNDRANTHRYLESRRAGCGTCGGTLKCLCEDQDQDLPLCRCRGACAPRPLG